MLLTKLLPLNPRNFSLSPFLRLFSVAALLFITLSNGFFCSRMYLVYEIRLQLIDSVFYGKLFFVHFLTGPVNGEKMYHLMIFI